MDTTVILPAKNMVTSLSLNSRLSYADFSFLSNSLKCGRLCTAKSLNSIEYSASGVFGLPALLNSPNIFSPNLEQGN